MKKILFIISGSISAYKNLDLIKDLIKKNFSIEVILTKSGKEFVTPIAISSLINKKIHIDMFNDNSNNNMKHINLSRKTDLILVCPASANIIAKLANGYADDLASTTLAASDKQIYVVPAMNKKMWENPANKENIKKLISRGIKIIGPISGNLACGEIGMGRIQDIKIIKDEINNFFLNKDKLKGKNILITAGPTVEMIDPIRCISNLSSGKQGYEITNAANNFGAKTILISGPSSIELPHANKIIKVETAEEMYNKSLNICKEYKNIDAAILTAAVSDWKIITANKKFKKNENIFKEIKFKKNKDILSSISNLKNYRPKIVCGFAAETNSIIKNARSKLVKKNCDFIFANKISTKFNPINNNYNEISMIGKNKEIKWKRMKKNKIAEKIINEISLYIN